MSSASWVVLLFTLICSGEKLEEEGEIYYGQLHEGFPDEGTLTHVTFRTRLRSQEDLTNREFHILTLQLPGDERGTDIHLIRTDFHQTQSNGGVSQQNFISTFSGQFPKGSVSFTTSSMSPGFSGSIIIKDGEHFVIEPTTTKLKSELINRKKRSASKGVTLTHKIYKVSETLKGNQTTTRTDVLRVPKKELEKALEEMAKDFANDSNSTSSSSMNAGSIEITLDEEDDSTSFTSVLRGGEKTRGRNRGKNKTKPWSTSGAGKWSTSGAGKWSTSGAGKSSTSGAGKSSKSGAAKGLGATTASKIVDLAVFTDSKLYEVWRGRYPTDASARVKSYVLAVINDMNLLYEQPSLGNSITFRLVKLEVMTSAPSGLDSNGGESAKYLKSFCTYAGDKNERGHMWDHAIMLTGHDLKEGSNMNVAGTAYFATMCLKYWSCSIAEGKSFATVHTLTHELGHSFGMEHDGTGLSTSCSADQFIMSWSTGVGKTTWSSCSSKSAKQFMATGSPDPSKSNPANIPVCLTHSSTLKNQKINYSPGKLPGEIFNLATQCNYECGNNCSPNLKNPENVCAMLYCGFSSGGRRDWAAHPALEGSPCGSGKVCKYGKCVKSSRSAG